MLREEVMTKLTDIIVHDIFFEDGEERQIEINENSELTALGFDSIALMTLFVCLEDEFFITMTDEELMIDFVYISDVVDYIMSKQK